MIILYSTYRMLISYLSNSTIKTVSEYSITSISSKMHLKYQCKNTSYAESKWHYKWSIIIYYIINADAFVTGWIGANPAVTDSKGS